MRLSEQASENARLLHITHELNGASELSLHRCLVREVGKALEATRVVLYQRNDEGRYRLRAQHAADGIAPLRIEHQLPCFSLQKRSDGVTSARMPGTSERGTDTETESEIESVHEEQRVGDLSTRASDFEAFRTRLETGTIAAAHVPLQGRDDLLLAVFRAEPPSEAVERAFSESEKRFVERTSELAGRVLDHASRRADATTSASVRGNLLRASQALLAVHDLETVFELATSVAAPLAGSRAGAILSLGPDGWRLDAQSGFDTRLAQFELGELSSCFDRALRDRAPVLVDHGLRASEDSSEDSVNPLLVLPVAYGHEALGVFLFEADKPSRTGIPSWSTDEWSRARIVTELTAAAWKNARKYQELKRTADGLERQLRESQKRELVGMLAGGIAHDFNNLLGGIVGSASLLQTQVGDSATAAKHLETIQKAARRGSALAGRLVAAVSASGESLPDGRSATRRRPFSPNEFVSDTLDLLSQTLAKKIHIVQSLDARVPALAMDPGAFQQIVLNLCVNARDAMPMGGKLFVETSFEHREDGSDSSGGVLCLSVTDSGTGIDDETRKRLFEPFYTTKGAQSSGLGLSVVREIVSSVGGSIDVESSVGDGARFVVRIPVSGPTSTEEPHLSDASRSAGAEARSPDEHRNGAGERILLVDDELVLLEIGRQILEEQGYSVKTASSGEEALRILRADRQPFSLVILDLVMPGLDGLETFREIRRIHGALPVLISSGLTSESTALELLRDGAEGFIPKPYDVAELADAVFEALHGRASTVVH